MGALISLKLFGFDLSMMAIIGLIMLIGIVKKNAIMMIDFALQRERHDGLSPEDSIYDAAVLRFRPIMMTTMAALLGTLPIAIGVGAGADLRQPLGVAVVGGLIVSQALTLFTTPVTYLYMDATQQFREPVFPARREGLLADRRRNANQARSLLTQRVVQPWVARGCSCVDKLDTTESLREIPFGRVRGRLFGEQSDIVPKCEQTRSRARVAADD